MSTNTTKKIRNIAIIAHVDHGKTTLSEQLIRQSSKLNTDKQLLDGDAQEAKRGITILAKCAGFEYKGVRINLMDTPGHKDFGSEVERVLGTGMVDGVLLIIDVLEGIMPQTQTVLDHAIRNKLKCIIVVNKVDRDGSSKEQALRVADSVIEKLYLSTQDEASLASPVIFASGRAGISSLEYDDVVSGKAKDLSSLLDLILNEIPEPTIESMNYTKCSVTMLDYDDYLGKVCIGRVHAGRLVNTTNERSKLFSMSLNHETQASEFVENVSVTKLFRYVGTTRIEVSEVEAGDIYAICGADKTSINDTLVSQKDIVPFQPTRIEPPMLSVSVFANRSPVAGKEGHRDKINARHLLDRLDKERRLNPGMNIIPRGEETELQSRGELQLGYLFENMIKEGFEFMVGSPKILTTMENGIELNPVEEMIITIEDEFIGAVMSKLETRNAILMSQDAGQEAGTSQLVFEIATSNLFGYSNEFMTDTRGTGRMSRRFIGYKDIGKNIAKKRISFLIATESGKATNYAMDALRSRGSFIVESGTEVFKDMIVGITHEDRHVHINIAKEKKLTNVRSAGKDEHMQPLPIKYITPEEAINIICEPGVILELTPKSLRLWCYNDK